MSEESKVRDVVDAVAGVAKAVPIYQDAVQPAAQEIGKALQTVAKTVHVALAPVSALVWGYEQIKDFVSTKVADRLKNVPPENIVTPKPNVAGPALESLRYTGHEHTLSDLYANLLAASMDRKTANEAHPAFVEIIKQLTPDEARLLVRLASAGPNPLINVRSEYNDAVEGKSGGSTILVNYSLLGIEAGVEFDDLTPSYIDNVCRLGLAEIPPMSEYTSPGVYDAVEQSEVIQALVIQIESDPERKCALERRVLNLSELGKQFSRVCIQQKT